MKSERWFQRPIFRRVTNGIARRTKRFQSEVVEQNATYDQQTVAVMKRVLQPTSNCVDIGANQGDILKHMIALAPQGTHHAFEALPYLAAELTRTYPQVQVHEVAVSDASGEADFQHVENDPAYSGLRRRVYDRPDPQIATIRVRVVALDDILPPHQRITFVKIDIEGGEYHAMKGAARMIQRWQPTVVFEAGLKSTGQYGVTPEDLYTFITRTLDYDLSTMDRWLKSRPAFTSVEFSHNWHNGPDFYFIATARPVGPAGHERKGRAL